MSFRPRKDRGLTAGSEEQQLWQSVRNYLRSLEKLGQTSGQEVANLEAKRRRFVEEKSGSRESSISLEEVSKDDLSSLYRQLDKVYEDEHREISKALESLEVLVAVRDGSNHADSQAKRKKRRIDTAVSSSISPPLSGTSTTKERNTSPATFRDDTVTSSNSLVAPLPEKEKKRSNSKSNVSASNSNVPSLQRRGTLSSTSLTKDTGSTILTSASQSTTSSTGNNAKESNRDASSTSTGSGYIDPARARREVLAHQLPLQKGRKVAFRQPSKNRVGPGAANVSNMTSRSASSTNTATNVQGLTTGQGGVAVPDDEGETWIMATIIECINNDRNRYVVQDAEDTAMPTYNTTLKAIVPLPESLTTLPLEDYKMGTQVMGLYPDTSCFYRAIVRGGGPGLNGKLTAKMQRRADDLLNTPYRLEFEDDGGAIQNVPASLVVERP